MQDTDTLIIETINRYCTGELSDETDLYKMGLNSLKAIPVSYTHLDVYKRQNMNTTTLVSYRNGYFSSVKKIKRYQVGTYHTY